MKYDKNYIIHSLQRQLVTIRSLRDLVPRQSYTVARSQVLERILYERWFYKRSITF